MVLESWTGTPGPNPGLIKEVYESQETEDVVDSERYDLREMYQGCQFGRSVGRPNHQVARNPGSWRRQRRESPVSGNSLW